MMTALAAVCFFLAQPLPSEVLAAPAAEPAKSTAAPSSVDASTDTDKALTIVDLYKAVRDPFTPVTAASVLPLKPVSAAVDAPAAEEEPPEPEFSIHFLSLKGIMKDRRGASAILVHEKTGQGYLLRGGKLYDYKNNRIPGVTGVVKPKEKTVILMTPDKDVQPLFLGETGDPSDKKEPARAAPKAAAPAAPALPPPAPPAAAPAQPSSPPSGPSAMPMMPGFPGGR